MGWQSDRYWPARDQLLTEKKIVRGLGRGGSVRLATPQTAPPAPVPAAPPLKQEADLYAPAAKVLESEWAKDFNLDDFFVQITAKQGRRETGGTWTRPDIVMVTVTNYQFLFGKVVDVITFEIKGTEGFDVTAIYEAMAQRRAATRSYVLIYCPADQRESLNPTIQEVSEEAKRQGVGLIVAADIANYTTWEFLVEAEREEPDPARLEDFVGVQVNEDNKRKLRKWVK